MLLSAGLYLQLQLRALGLRALGGPQGPLAPLSFRFRLRCRLGFWGWVFLGLELSHKPSQQPLLVLWTQRQSKMIVAVVMLQGMSSISLI